MADVLLPDLLDVCGTVAPVVGSVHLGARLDDVALHCDCHSLVQLRIEVDLVEKLAVRALGQAVLVVGLLHELVTSDVRVVESFRRSS